MGKVVMAGGGGGTASSDCTATANLVVEGKTYLGEDTNDDIGTGTLKNQNVVDSALGGLNSSYPNVPVHKGTYPQFGTTTQSKERLFATRPDRGYWGGDSYVAIPAMNKNVTPSIVSQTIYADSGKVLESVIVGAIPNQRGQSQKSAKCYTYKHTDGVTYLINWLLAGWYSAWQPTSGGTATYAEVWTKQADVASALGLTADKIKKGTTICGITGTWEGYVAGSGDLYNKGALGLGGGFTAVPYYADDYSDGAAWYMKVGGTLSYDTAQMRVEGNTLWLASNQAVNLSAYSKLNVTFRINKADRIRVQVTYNKPSAGMSKSNNVATNAYGGGSKDTTTTVSLDISSINANCYVSFGWTSGTSDSAQMIVERVWLS